MSTRAAPNKPLRARIFYGWYIVAACVGLNFYLSVVFFQGFQAFFLPISDEFQWSRTLTSSAFSLRQLEAGLMAPVVGFLVDRWGPRTVILAGVVFGGLGMVLMSSTNGLLMFYLAFGIISLGMSGASHGVSWAVAISYWFRRRRGQALGIGLMGPVVGGPFVATIAILEEAIGWRMAVLVLGVGLWVVGIPLALVARSQPERYGLVADGDEAPRVSSADPNERTPTFSAASNGHTVREATRTGTFWLLLVLMGVPFVGVSGLMVHLIPLLEGVGYSSTGAASILGLVFLLSGIGRMGVGIVADRADSRRALLGLLAAEVVALILLTRIVSPSYWQVGMFALLLGVGFGGVIPLRPSLVAETFGARSLGSIQGLMTGGAIGAGVFGPVFYGWVFDVTQSYDIALYVSAAIAAAAIPLVLLLRPRQRVLASRDSSPVQQ